MLKQTVLKYPFESAKSVIIKTKLASLSNITGRCCRGWALHKIIRGMKTIRKIESEHVQIPVLGLSKKNKNVYKYMSHLKFKKMNRN